MVIPSGPGLLSRADLFKYFKSQEFDLSEGL